MSATACWPRWINSWMINWISDLVRVCGPCAKQSYTLKEHSATEVQFAENAETALAQVCSLPWGAKVTMGWAVWHVLEHEIHHRGEIYLMLGMLGMEAPDV